MKNKLDRILIIPAYNPDGDFINFTANLSNIFDKLIIINDGSDQEFNHVFTKINANNIAILIHSKNQGKGSALKTGFKYYLDHFSKSNKGVVTADADGQHSIQDIEKILINLLSSTNKLIIGSRDFNTNKPPLKSRVGNILTSKVLRILYGINIHDTQSGLRGIPNDLIRIYTTIKSSRYEYELECLLAAHKNKFPISEISIQTIYFDNNEKSHFKPIRDSFKVYDSLLKYGEISIFSILIDNLVFVLVLYLTNNLLSSYVISRTLSSLFNFYLLKTTIIKPEISLARSGSIYTLLVIANLIISYYAVLFFTETLLTPVIATKLIIDFALFIINYHVYKNKSLWNKKV